MMPVEITQYAFQSTHRSASRPVQRGTKRSSGKRKKQRIRETTPKNATTLTDHHHTGCWLASAPRGLGKVAPNVRSMRETNHANRSWDFRQKITAATRNHTAAKINSKVNEYVA